MILRTGWFLIWRGSIVTLHVIICTTSYPPTKSLLNDKIAFIGTMRRNKKFLSNFFLPNDQTQYRTIWLPTSCLFAIPMCSHPQTICYTLEDNAWLCNRKSNRKASNNCRLQYHKTMDWRSGQAVQHPNRYKKNFLLTIQIPV